MPRTDKENLEDTRPGDAPEFPDDEEKVAVIEESFFPEEEKEGETGEPMEETEQPTLFEGDKVYNELQISLRDIKESLQRNKKKFENIKLEKSILDKRQQEILEAIEDFEQRMAEKE